VMSVMGLDHGQVRMVLPQAAPMVLIDRVEWLDPGRELRAVKAVNGSEPCYEHLPGGLPRQRYAYPTSLLLESFGQAAAVLWHSRDGRLVDGNSLLMFAAAHDCQFYGRAYPGDVVRHEVRFERLIANTGFATGESWVGDRRIATMGTFIAAVRPLSMLPDDNRSI
jgi:3-hydroxyacyl-[acyl-carrier-protein] dehydratase